LEHTIRKLLRSAEKNKFVTFPLLQQTQNRGDKRMQREGTFVMDEEDDAMAAKFRTDLTLVQHDSIGQMTAALNVTSVRSPLSDEQQNSQFVSTSNQHEDPWKMASHYSPDSEPLEMLPPAVSTGVSVLVETPTNMWNQTKSWTVQSGNAREEPTLRPRMLRTSKERFLRVRHRSTGLSCPPASPACQPKDVSRRGSTQSAHRNSIPYVDSMSDSDEEVENNRNPCDTMTRLINSGDATMNILVAIYIHLLHWRRSFSCKTVGDWMSCLAFAIRIYSFPESITELEVNIDWLRDIECTMDNWMAFQKEQRHGREWAFSADMLRVMANMKNSLVCAVAMEVLLPLKDTQKGKALFDAFIAVCSSLGRPLTQFALPK
jgi:hypothetical protein